MSNDYNTALALWLDRGHLDLGQPEQAGFRKLTQEFGGSSNDNAAVRAVLKSALDIIRGDLTNYPCDLIMDDSFEVTSCQGINSEMAHENMVNFCMIAHRPNYLKLVTYEL